jgi:hypothetical protein
MPYVRREAAGAFEIVHRASSLQSMEYLAADRKFAGFFGRAPDSGIEPEGGSETRCGRARRAVVAMPGTRSMIIPIWVALQLLLPPMSIASEDVGIAIADAAVESRGDYSWMPRDPIFLFGLQIGDPKYLCNFYVADTIEMAGLPRPLIGGRTPSASDWGNPIKVIRGFEIVYPTPETSDLSAEQIMALRRPGDVISSGSHVGVVEYDSKTISAVATHRVNRVPLPIELQPSVPTRDLDEFGAVRSTDFGWPRPTPADKSAAAWEDRAKNHLRHFVVRRYVGGVKPEAHAMRAWREFRESTIYLFPQRPIAPFAAPKPPATGGQRVPLNRVPRKAQVLGTSGCLVARSGRSTTVLACDSNPQDAMFHFSHVAERLMPRDFWWHMGTSRVQYLWIDADPRVRPSRVENPSELVGAVLKDVYQSREIRRLRNEGLKTYDREVLANRHAEAKALSLRRQIAAENAMRSQIISLSAAGAARTGTGTRNGSGADRHRASVGPSLCPFDDCFYYELGTFRR